MGCNCGPGAGRGATDSSPAGCVRGGPRIISRAVPTSPRSDPNVASTAAFAPLPYAAVYSASKAFVLSFSEALFGECEDKGVHVLALCPGGTQSNFAAVAAGAPGLKTPTLDTAESVAEAGLKAFLAKRTFLITGKGNGRIAMLARLMSRKRVVRTPARCGRACC